MKLNMFKSSIIDKGTIEEFEGDTKTQWTDKDEIMAIICSAFGYGFNWNKKGNIVVNEGYYTDCENCDCSFHGKNSCGHFEYETIDDMLKDWKTEILKVNNDSTILMNFDNKLIEFINQLQ